MIETPRIKVSEHIATVLQNLNKTYLLSSEGRILILQDVKIDVEHTKKWYGEGDQYYVNFNIKAYFPVLKSWGYITDRCVENYIQYDNFYKMRQRWLDLNEALNANGFILTHKPEPNEILPETKECTPNGD